MSDLSPAAARSAAQAQDDAGMLREQKLMAAGGIFGALAASSCCVLPLVLVTIGVSGAWIGNLAAFAPYQPYIVALTLGFLGYGFYLVYWRRQVCADGSCARPRPNRIVATILWVATVIIVIALIFPPVALWLAGS